ncbi:MAG: GntR family transcriptional regulator [bacterium]
MFNNNEPIFIQIARWIENRIIDGTYKEETQIMSTTEMSLLYKVNPATILKGYNLLIDKNIIYKKRGLGMFVNTGALDLLVENKKTILLSNEVSKLIKQAKALKITKEELISEIEKEYTND